MITYQHIDYAIPNTRVNFPQLPSIILVFSQPIRDLLKEQDITCFLPYGSFLKDTTTKVEDPEDYILKYYFSILLKNVIYVSKDQFVSEDLSFTFNSEDNHPFILKFLIREWLQSEEKFKDCIYIKDLIISLNNNLLSQIL